MKLAFPEKLDEIDSRVVVCIYTCERDYIDHRRILSSISLENILKERKIPYNFILASPELDTEYIHIPSKRELLVRATESYGTLSIKTQKMISACLDIYSDVNYIVKFDGDLGIDVSSSLSMRLDQVKAITSQDSGDDYIGVQKMSLTKPDFRRWFKLKAKSRFPGRKPFNQTWDTHLSSLKYFYRGLCYRISKEFAIYIRDNPGIADFFARHFNGSEDVMIRYYYHLYTQDKESHV